MARTIHVSTDLPTDAEQVWSALQQPVTFLYVVRGLFGVPLLSGRSAPLVAGESGTGWLFAFHLIPAHRHTIEVLEVDDATRTIRTHEHGGVLRRWDHVLHAEPVDAGLDPTGEPVAACRYSDTVTIDAGRLTPVVAAGAVALYRYRHRRWHRLVRRQLRPADASPTDVGSPTIRPARRSALRFAIRFRTWRTSRSAATRHPTGRSRP